MRIWLITAMLLGGASFALAQDPTEEPSEPLDPAEMEQTFFVEFNRVLRDELEARPVARNPILDEVAEEIAQLVGCTNDEVEFDIQSEVKARGFATFPEENSVRVTRIPLLPIVNARPIGEMAQFYAADIYETNINQPGRFYREIGVGVVPCIVDLGDEAQGSTQQYGLFVILGVEPNVIPVVVENGELELEAEAAPLTVELSIHQENSRQLPEIFGRGEVMRFSNEPLDGSETAVRYAETLEWELESCGPNTIYYELEDTAGVTLGGEVDVEVICP